MKFGLSEKTIQKISNIFAAHPQVEKAVIFGSRAKGNYKNGSDIDLTLHGKELTQKLLRKIELELDDLLLPYKIDVSIFDQISNPEFVGHILRVGLVFYEKKISGDHKSDGKKKAEGWKVEKLGDVIQKTETINPLQTPNKEFIYIDVSSVNNKTLSIEETSLIKGKDAPSRARKLIKAGDVIFATVRPTLKRIAVIPEEYNHQVCSTGYFVLRGKESINNKYLFYYLQTDSFNERMEKLQKGASYPAVTDTEVKEQIIAYPPLPEQQRIVSVLDEAFASIAQAKSNAKRNLVNARELFWSVLQSSMSNDGWDKKTLKEISIIFGRGKSKNRPRNDPKLYGGEYPFIQTGDIRNSNHYITEYTQTYNEVGLAQSKLWKKGTICITIAANIAETGILGFDACFPDSVIGLVVNPKIADVDFIEYLLQFFKKKLQAKGKGSAQDNLNMEKFENEYFPIPPLAEQRAIVGRLEALSAETGRLEEIYQSKVEALEELKRSVLGKAFEGEL